MPFLKDDLVVVIFSNFLLSLLSEINCFQSICLKFVTCDGSVADMCFLECWESSVKTDQLGRSDLIAANNLNRFS